MKIMHKRKWSRVIVIQNIRKLYEKGKLLNVYYISRKHRKLYDAACWHFSSFRKAVKAVGLDDEMIKEKIAQIRKEIISQIQELSRKNEALNASEVNKRYSMLYYRSRLYFGRHDKTLKAAGFNPKKIRLKRKAKKWNKEKVIKKIQRFHHQGKPLHSTYVQKHYPDLWGSIQRYFGNHEKGMKAAGLNYDKIRKQKKQHRSPEIVLSEIKVLKEKGIPLNEEFIKSAFPNLRYAGRRFFGLWRKAVEAAGFDYEQFLEKKWRGRQWINKLSEEKFNQIEKTIENLELPEKQSKISSMGEKKKTDRQSIEKTSLSPNQKKVLKEIKRLKSLKIPLNATYIKAHYKSLYHRACICFKSWKRAVVLIGIDYLKVQKGWDYRIWINRLSEKDLAKLEQQIISLGKGGIK